MYQAQELLELKVTVPTASGSKQLFASALGGSKTNIQDALRQIFPEQQEESSVQKARKIMGEAINNLTDAELDKYLTEFQYLIDSWVDDYERQVFEGLTLQQVTREE